MGLILRWLGGAAGPYLMIAVAAVMLSLASWGGVQTYRLASAHADLAELQDRFDKHLLADSRAESAATDKARQLEAQHALDLAAAEQRHLQELANERAEADRILDAERSGALKLRDKFRGCQAALDRAAPSAAAGSGHGEAQGGLQGPDVEFLVRLADEADGIVVQLNLAQSVIESQRRTCNAMSGSP